MRLPLISMANVNKRFASDFQALEGVTLQVAQGKLVSLLGPSGCGKSTVLRLVAGLDQASSGEILSPAVGAAPSSASTAFVFQDPTLMLWASVFDNVWLPLRLAGVSRADASERVVRQLVSVGLAEFAQAYPAELSGGMRMRASIACAAQRVRGRVPEPTGGGDGGQARPGAGRHRHR
jgi:NitT/TauT family transport system ATP-binding protein